MKKRLIAIAMVLLLSIGTVSIALAETKVYSNTFSLFGKNKKEETVDYSHTIFAGRSENSKQKGTISDDEDVIILRQRGKWAFIITTKNQWGWVYASTVGLQPLEDDEEIVYSEEEQPTEQSTEQPTEQPTEAPEEEDEGEFEPAPVIDPTEEPTPEPTEEPTPEPTEEPTPEPTEEPTPEPTEEPTPEPTEEPTPEPTEEPTPEPTEEPTPEPTEEPTPEPTEEPTPEPTEEPTPEPTEEFEEPTEEGEEPTEEGEEPTEEGEEPTEEGEEPTEEGEEPTEETAEFPENYTIEVRSDKHGKFVKRNEAITLTATLTGFEGYDYSLQWQYSADNGATFNDVAGANELTYTYKADRNSAKYLWRVSVEIG